MVTDLLLCRWIAAGFDEGFEKIKDFPLSLGEFFQKVHFRFVLLTGFGVNAVIGRGGIPLLSLP